MQYYDIGVTTTIITTNNPTWNNFFRGLGKDWKEKGKQCDKHFQHLLGLGFYELNSKGPQKYAFLLTYLIKSWMIMSGVQKYSIKSGLTFISPSLQSADSLSTILQQNPPVILTIIQPLILPVFWPS